MRLTHAFEHNFVWGFHRAVPEDRTNVPHLFGSGLGVCSGLCGDVRLVGLLWLQVLCTFCARRGSIWAICELILYSYACVPSPSTSNSWVVVVPDSAVFPVGWSSWRVVVVRPV